MCRSTCLYLHNFYSSTQNYQKKVIKYIHHIILSWRLSLNMTASWVQTAFFEWKLPNDNFPKFVHFTNLSSACSKSDMKYIAYVVA